MKVSNTTPGASFGKAGFLSAKEGAEKIDFCDFSFECWCINEKRSSYVNNLLYRMTGLAQILPGKESKKPGKELYNGTGGRFWA